MVLDDAAWAPVTSTKGERRAYTWATRLAWAYVGTHGDPGVLGLDEPGLGAPLPVYAGGRLISQDLANTSLEVASIREALGHEKPRSIVESERATGAALMSLYPYVRYTIIDIEPARTISRWYLENLFGTERVGWVAPEDVGSIRDQSFDLAVSISSLQEMRPETVAAYLDLLGRTMRGVVYLKQWTSWTNPVDRVTLTFADYPTAPHWRELLLRAAPIQTNFTEAAWSAS